MPEKKRSRSMGRIALSKRLFRKRWERKEEQKGSQRPTPVVGGQAVSNRTRSIPLGDQVSKGTTKFVRTTSDPTIMCRRADIYDEDFPDDELAFDRTHSSQSIGGSIDSEFFNKYAVQVMNIDPWDEPHLEKRQVVPSRRQAKSKKKIVLESTEMVTYSQRSTKPPISKESYMEEVKFDDETNAWSSSTGVTEMSQPEFSLLSELQDVFSDCTYMIRCGTECAGQR